MKNCLYNKNVKLIGFALVFIFLSALFSVFGMAQTFNQCPVIGQTTSCEEELFTQNNLDIIQMDADAPSVTPGIDAPAIKPDDGSTMGTIIIGSIGGGIILIGVIVLIIVNLRNRNKK